MSKDISYSFSGKWLFPGALSCKSPGGVGLPEGKLNERERNFTKFWRFRVLWQILQFYSKVWEQESDGAHLPEVNLENKQLDSDFNFLFQLQ